MKAWMFQTTTYVPSQPLPQVWPLPGAVYDPAIAERTFQEALEQSIIAEQLGFDGVSISEHHYAAASLTPNPTVMAAALSQRLHHAKIVLLGSTLPLTNPIRVAEEYAMLDNLTGGRFVAGLLRGTPNEFLTYGTNPNETRALYEESVELILKAWTEPQPFGWQGRHYQFRTVSLWPRPLQQPHPPVFVSANSKDSGRFAASHHLNMGLSFMPFSVAAQLSQFYQEQSRQAGWEPTSENKLYRGFIHVAPTDQQAVEEVAQTFWAQTGTQPTASATSSSVTPPVSGGAATATVPAMDTKEAINQALSGQSFAAVGLQFCGSPQTVLKQIRHLRDVTGVSTIDFVFRGPALSHDMTLRSLELFGKEVLPHLQEL